MVAIAHHRVAVFHAVEVQVEAVKNQWVRDKTKSTKPLAALINAFLEKNSATVVFISPPAVVQVASDAKSRTYRCSVSIVYQGKDVVYDDTNIDTYTGNDGSPDVFSKVVFADNTGISPAQQKIIENGIRATEEHAPWARKLDNTRVVEPVSASQRVTGKRDRKAVDREGQPARAKPAGDRPDNRPVKPKRVPINRRPDGRT
jgi:hypothetical protein